MYAPMGIRCPSASRSGRPGSYSIRAATAGDTATIAFAALMRRRPTLIDTPLPSCFNSETGEPSMTSSPSSCGYPLAYLLGAAAQVRILRAALEVGQLHQSAGALRVPEEIEVGQLGGLGAEDGPGDDA